MVDALTETVRDLPALEEVVEVASRPLTYSLFTDQIGATLQKRVAREIPLKIYVNGGELITLACTPQNLRELAVGFLYLEGLIQGLQEVAHVSAREDEGIVHVQLTRDVDLRARRLVIRGCGGGSTFTGPSRKTGKIVSSLRVAPSQILGLMDRLYGEAKLYQSTGGVHTSALSDGHQLVVVASDVGRHNTIDKLQGRCLLEGITTWERILLTTGRLSTEMLNKGARMQVPILVSRSSPTDMAVEMAEARGITLIGYACHDQIHVYCGAERVVGRFRGLPQIRAAVGQVAQPC